MNVLMHISLHRILVVIFHPPCRCNETEILKEKMKIPHHVSLSRSRLSPIKKNRSDGRTATATHIKPAKAKRSCMAWYAPSLQANYDELLSPELLTRKPRIT
jgi:hypothetical protein